MAKNILYILLILKVNLLSLSFHLYGQSIAYNLFTEDNGLPSNNIFDLHLDHQNKLWIATDQGILSFDGLNFDTYTINEGLPNNEVWKFHRDDYNRLWLINSESFGHYIENDSIKVFDSLYLNRSNTRIRSPISFAYHSRGIAYFGVNNILIVDKDKVIHIGQHKNNVKQYPLYIDTIFRYYVENPNIVPSYNLNSFIHYNSDLRDQTLSLTDNQSTILTNEYESIIVDYNKHELTHYTKDDVSVTSLPHHSNHILPVINHDVLELPYETGITRYNIASRQSQHFEYRGPFKHTRSITFDNFVLAGTQRNGLAIYNSSIGQMKTDLSQIDQICVTKNQRILLSENNILSINQKSNPPNNTSLPPGYVHLKKIKNDCYLLFQSTIKNLSQNKTLPALSSSSLENSNEPHLTNQIQRHRAFNSMSYFNFFGDNFIKSNRYSTFIGELINDEFQCRTLPVTDIQEIIFDTSQSKFIISSSSGTYSTETIDDVIFPKKVNQFDAQKIILKKDTAIYISTNGIIRARDYNNVIDTLTFPSTSKIYKVLVTDSSALFNTEDYFVKYNFHTHHIDCFPYATFFNNIHITDFDFNSDTLYFTGGRDVYQIPFRRLHKSVNTPELVVHLNKKPISKEQNYELSAGSNSFDISCKVKSLLSLGTQNLQYKISPNDHSWNTVTDSIISFRSLASGKYNVQIRGYDSFHNRTDLFTFSLTIPVPWYSSVWFYILITLLSSASIVSYILINQEQRRKAEREQNEIKKRFASLELDALRAQMNPHFIFNSLSAIQAFIRQSNKEAADDYLSKFAILIRTFLDQSRSRQVRLSEEIKLLQNYVQLENLRIGNSIQTEWTIDPEIDTYDKIPSLLLQPFIENAINHGLFHKKGHKQLTIKFDYIEDGLLIQIIDNGIGRHASKKINQQMKPQHESKGMTIIEERIATINTSGEYFISYSIHDRDSATQTGTHVTVIIKQL